MTDLHRRAAAWALIGGSALAAAGYLAAFTVTDPGTRYTDPRWMPLYAVALAGTVVLVAGLPLLPAVHGRGTPRLMLVGTAGLYLALVMLNLAEGTIEAFVKPYLAGHGGIPDGAPGLDQWESAALVALVVGVGCLGAALIREGGPGRWIGALVLAGGLASFLPLPGGLALIGDYLVLAAFIAVGLLALRAGSADQRAIPAAAGTHRSG